MTRTIAAADLPPQAYAHAPDFNRGLLDRWRPIRNGGVPWQKPTGGTGLWTATRFEDGSTSWTRWCAEEGWRVEEYAAQTLLEPTPGARIALIDTLEDLVELVRVFPHRDERLYIDTHVDWEAAARVFDAVHLTDGGQWRTRLTLPLGLNGWDCESTLWLQPAFRVLAPEVAS